ncbi:MarR family winged helix-turn-helix transcriptional regulator [Erythrobacter crassostreae]|uniref:Winged helix-turn-helix transcriptional regulator n=1 Tax=Erythrobacter crassostreae TaxID=2828328 RepID=A0A9X1F425_9SPHN|nr:MarR family winged helix-turn-helix transcriptional regulator [Erythrobacter crassostrea]MBV7259399.1 winged helix-turn-helix transcriptional regulator [Erythrobacter crassostrea]
MDDKLIANTCYATRARRAARHLSRMYDDALRPHGIKVSQFSILVAASVSRGDATITELADELGLERSTLSRNLQPLERRGLVEIGEEQQHRSRQVLLTAQGERLIEDAYGDWARVQDRARGQLPIDESAILGSLSALNAIT